MLDRTVVGDTTFGRIMAGDPKDAVPKIDFAELSISVRQMESRLQSDPDRLVRYLVDAYREMLPQLATEYADRRDQLLARSAALKLVREVARHSRRAV